MLDFEQRDVVSNVRDPLRRLCIGIGLLRPVLLAQKLRRHSNVTAIPRPQAGSRGIGQPFGSPPPPKFEPIPIPRFFPRAGSAYASASSAVRNRPTSMGLGRYAWTRRSFVRWRRSGTEWAVTKMTGILSMR